jgi:hypothetical protein
LIFLPKNVGRVHEPLSSIYIGKISQITTILLPTDDNNLAHLHWLRLNCFDKNATKSESDYTYFGSLGSMTTKCFVSVLPKEPRQVQPLLLLMMFSPMTMVLTH